MTDTNPLILHTPRLTLRLGTEPDAGAIVRFYEENRAHLAPWWPHFAPDFFTENYWRKRLAQDAQEFAENRSVRFFLFADAPTGSEPNFVSASASLATAGSIFTPETPPRHVVGMVNFNNIIQGSAMMCTVGYGLAAQAQGKGLLTEALREGIRYLFDDRNLHRVQANYIPHNVRSGAVLKRLGFVVEGYARDYLFINGQWQDHILTGLANPNWRPPDTG